MQAARTSSWRFVQTIDERPHVALFVREALGLKAAGDPPPLVGPLPEHNGRIDAEQRTAAALQWPSWWNAIIAAEGRRHLGFDQPDHKAWLRDCAAELRATGAPPDFIELSDRPELRAAVLATFDEADRWAKQFGVAELPPIGRPTFEWALTKQVAEDVAFDRDVAIAAVQGVAMVLAVHGDWWELLGPGLIVCSRPVSRNPAAAQAALRAAFESGLTRGFAAGAQRHSSPLR